MAVISSVLKVSKVIFNTYILYAVVYKFDVWPIVDRTTQKANILSYIFVLIKLPKM